jgi:hypothetical protein
MITTMNTDLIFMVRRKGGVGGVGTDDPTPPIIKRSGRDAEQDHAGREWVREG